MRSAILSALILVVMTANAVADKRVALVIGNSAYQNIAKLRTPENDAAAMAALFRQSGFDVVELRQNRYASDMLRDIENFSAITKDADTVVFFYAGHGLEYGGTNYLIPVDAKTSIDGRNDAITLEQILTALEPVAKLRVVLLDACRDNPFTSPTQTRGLAKGLAKIDPQNSTLIVFSAKAGSASVEGDELNSPFTTALIKNIVQPGLDIRIALGTVRDDVLQSTGGQQEPFVYGSLGGDIFTLAPVMQTTPR